jgi:DNA uptake protein ComE-like DNA-binding protein
MKHIARERRRSFVLIAVLVIVGASLLVATSQLFVAQTELAVSSGAGESAQSRALAWSGLQAVMAELNDQRSLILAGESPHLDPKIVVYEFAARQGVVRMMPVSGVSGELLLVAEAGKVDVNRANAETLAAVGLMSSEVARAVADYVQSMGGRVQGLNELMRVPGGVITAETLWGAFDESTSFASSATTSENSEPCVRGLSDVLTVFGVEPLLQIDGSPRINLNTSWSEDLARQISARFGADVTQQVQAAFEQGERFELDSAIVKSLRRLNVDVEDWPAVLDAFSTEAGPLRAGRLDINTAPYESLLALPGITTEQAAQLVQVRPTLDDRERSSVAWPVIQRILAPEQFEVIVDHITTRCWMWRVRLAAGEVGADQPERWLGHPVIYEAVIDVSDAQPRIAYLRDITVLEETQAIAAGSMSRATHSDDRARASAPVQSEVETSTKAAPVSASGDQSSPARTSEELRISRWHGT